MKCIFKQKHGYGARIFYYRFNEPEENKFDYEYVWVYLDKDLNNCVVGLHVSNIVKIQNNTQTELVGGSEYLTTEEFGKVHEEFIS